MSGHLTELQKAKAFLLGLNLVYVPVRAEWFAVRLDDGKYLSEWHALNDTVPPEKVYSRDPDALIHRASIVFKNPRHWY